MQRHHHHGERPLSPMWRAERASAKKRRGGGRGRKGRRPRELHAVEGLRLHTDAAMALHDSNDGMGHGNRRHAADDVAPTSPAAPALAPTLNESIHDPSQMLSGSPTPTVLWAGNIAVSGERIKYCSSVMVGVLWGDPWSTWAQTKRQDSSLPSVSAQRQLTTSVGPKRLMP